MEIITINQFSNFENKKRVAAYVRVSTKNEEQEHSYEQQMDAYRKMILNNPSWELVDVYGDQGYTGTKDERPSFQKMMNGCRNKEIDMIITKSITRLARNTTLLLQTIRELLTLDVDIYFEKENFHSKSSEGELLLTLLASFAEEESRSISENNKWATTRRFEKGLAHTCNVYGYKLLDGKFIIIPEEAKIVKYIFAQYLSGAGNKTIAKSLNDLGVPTKRGKTWTAGTIYDMLRNEKYTGNMTLNISYHKDYITKKKVINHGERPFYKVKNSHEAIIDQATFDAVQAEIKARVGRTKPRMPKRTYPYTSLITCGICGKNYVHINVRPDAEKKDHDFWACQTYYNYGKANCPSKRIPSYALDAKTKELLGIDDLNDIRKYVNKIVVPEQFHLVYYLTSGEVKDVYWEHKKPDHSRK